MLARHQPASRAAMQLPTEPLACFLTLPMQPNFLHRACVAKLNDKVDKQYIRWANVQMSKQYLWRCKLWTDTPRASAKRSCISCLNLKVELLVSFCQVNFFLYLAFGMLRSILVMWRSTEDVIFQPWRRPWGQLKHLLVFWYCTLLWWWWQHTW